MALALYKPISSEHVLVDFLAPRKSFDILALYKSDYYYYYYYYFHCHQQSAILFSRRVYALASGTSELVVIAIFTNVFS